MDFPVTQLPATEHVAVGETAPDFTRPLVTPEYWEDVALTDLLVDGPVLLVFHPMDGSFVTTYVWNELRERGFDRRDAQVVGVSISSPYEHKDTIRRRDIQSFTGLYSDPQNDVAEAYGVAHDLDGMAGLSEPRPAVFLVDEDRTVEYAWVATEWPDFPDYDAIEAAIDGR